MPMLKYTSPAALKRAASRAARIQSKAPEFYYTWIEQATERARAAGMLLSDVQYADSVAGRPLRTGDRARYVGPSRVESHEHGTYVRVQGQEGTVIDVIDRTDRVGNVVLVTFQPDIESGAREAALTGVVNVVIGRLVVAEGTPGYWDLERITE